MNINNHSKNKKGKYLKIVITFLVFAFIIYVGYDGLSNKGKIDYKRDRNKTVLTIDGENITFSDIAYYFLRKERDIEEEALIYNPSAPKDFWNTQKHGIILSAKVKKETLELIIHDAIIYKLAKENKVELNLKEQEYFSDKRKDFWDDLYEEQLENLYTTRANVNIAMKKTAIAQKYQKMLAEKKKISYARLSYGGDIYENMLKEHKVRVNKRLWNRVIMGKVTLRHHKVNFVHKILN